MQAYEDGKDVHARRPEMYAGQRDALASERMSNVIPMFASRVVQSAYRYHSLYRQSINLFASLKG